MLLFKTKKQHEETTKRILAIQAQVEESDRLLDDIGKRSKRLKATMDGEDDWFLLTRKECDDP